MEWSTAFLANPVIDAIGWTLVHFIWQGLLIGATVYIVLSLLRKSRASTRYIILFLGMLALLAAPINTFTDIYSSTDYNKPRISVSEAPSTDITVTQHKQSNGFSYQVRSNNDNGLAPESASATTGWLSGTAQSWFGEGKITHVAQQIDHWMVSNLEWLVVAWFVGMFLMAMRLIGGFVYVQWVRHYKASPAAEQLQEKMQQLKSRLGINDPVSLLQTVRVKVPMVIGWMKPAILIPTSMLTGLTPEQIESIIAHELAHIRRYDYLINIFQLMVETLLFFHPVVWWMSNEMRIEREHSCDDLAVAVTGDAMTYARALTNLEELRAGTNSGIYAMAATDGSLLSRIRRIMGVHSGDANQSSNWLVGLLILAGLVGVGATYANDQLDSIKQRMADTETTEAQSLATMWNQNSETDDSNPNPNYNYNYNYNYSVNSEADNVDLGKLAELEKLSKLGELSKLQELAKLEALNALKAEKNVSNAEFWAKYGEEWGKKWGDTWGKAWSEANADKISASVQAAMENLEMSFSNRNYYDEDGEYSVQELIEMKKYGVTREYINDLSSVGYERLAADVLIDFKKYGVSISLIKALNKAGFKELNPDELIDVAKYNVSVEYIQQMQNVGFSDLRIDDIVDMKKYGADAQLIAALRAQGFTAIDPEDVVDMAKYGVDATYIQQIRNAGFDQVRPGEVADMKKYGVTGEYVQSLQNAGINISDVDGIVDMRKYGVDSSYINAMREVLGEKQVIQPELWSDMYKYGLKPELVVAVNEYGVQQLNLERLIDMAKYGVDKAFLKELTDNDLKNLTAEEIIDLKKYGVDAEYIKSMRN